MRSIVLACLVVMLSGCALTKTQRDIVYEPFVDRSSLGALSDTSLQLGPFTDARAVDDPRLIFHKKNMYNNTMSGAYVAPRPIVEYVKDGVLAYLELADPRSTATRLTLAASLEELHEEVLMGFWKSKLRTSMTVEFSLSNGDHVIWSESITGRALIEKGDFVQQTVTKTTDDLIKELMTDAQFQAAVRDSVHQ